MNELGHWWRGLASENVILAKMYSDRVTAESKSNNVPIGRKSLRTGVREREVGTSTSLERVWPTEVCSTVMESEGRCSICSVQIERVERPSIAISGPGGGDGSRGGISGVAEVPSRIAKGGLETSSSVLKPAFALLSPSAPVARVDGNAKFRSSCSLKTRANL